MIVILKLVTGEEVVAEYKEDTQEYRQVTKSVDSQTSNPGDHSMDECTQNHRSPTRRTEGSG